MLWWFFGNTLIFTFLRLSRCPFFALLSCPYVFFCPVFFVLMSICAKVSFYSMVFLPSCSSSVLLSFLLPCFPSILMSFGPLSFLLSFLWIDVLFQYCFYSILYSSCPLVLNYLVWYPFPVLFCFSYPAVLFLYCWPCSVFLSHCHVVMPVISWGFFYNTSGYRRV